MPHKLRIQIRVRTQVYTYTQPTPTCAHCAYMLRAPSWGLRWHGGTREHRTAQRARRFLPPSRGTIGRRRLDAHTAEGRHGKTFQDDRSCLMALKLSSRPGALGHRRKRGGADGLASQLAARRRGK